jgi:hypothetical protein
VDGSSAKALTGCGRAVREGSGRERGGGTKAGRERSQGPGSTAQISARALARLVRGTTLLVQRVRTARAMHEGGPHSRRSFRSRPCTRGRGTRRLRCLLELDRRRRWAFGRHARASHVPQRAYRQIIPRYLEHMRQRPIVTPSVVCQRHRQHPQRCVSLEEPSETDGIARRQSASPWAWRVPARGLEASSAAGPRSYSSPTLDAPPGAAEGQTSTSNNR